MTEAQWDDLVKVIRGELLVSKSIGFIIDSPWLPGWYGVSILDYYTNDEIWFDANFKAVNTFPEAMFLPGFWSEYGMCTEPSAFGSKMIWNKKNLPHAEKMIHELSAIDLLRKPDPRTDGLLPFMINRLKNKKIRIEAAGHSVKFAISRGPLNIASFLMGTTELMMGIAMQPDAIHKLLSLITDFTIDWLEVQIHKFPTIDGIFILDDLVGFLGEPDFKSFAFPYLKRIYDHFSVTIKFFHNDAQGLITASHLSDLGVNLFNFSHEHSLKEMHELTGGNVTLMGNIPPRDVLATGKPGDVDKSVRDAWLSIDDRSRIIWSCGGGMPMDVSSENIHSFINTVRQLQ